jgi:hypothetical protein
MGNNQLGQVVYDSHSGGCHDGIETHNLNLNQGAESTICYLMARLEMFNNTFTNKKQEQFPKELIIPKISSFDKVYINQTPAYL